MAHSLKVKSTRFFKAGYTILYIFVLLIPGGCVKDFPKEISLNYEWKPTFAFPIGAADFGLKIPYGFDPVLLETDPLTGFPYWSFLETIPMSGGIDFDFEQVLGTRDEINYVILQVNAYNGFPIEIEIQAYLESASGEVMDSLFIPKMILERGELEAGGGTRLETHTQREIQFDHDRLDLLLEAKKITFTGELKTVSYFPEYSFTVQLGAILGIISEFKSN